MYEYAYKKVTLKIEIEIVVIKILRMHLNLYKYFLVQKEFNDFHFHIDKSFINNYMTLKCDEANTRTTFSALSFFYIFVYFFMCSRNCMNTGLNKFVLFFDFCNFIFLFFFFNIKGLHLTFLQVS